MKKQKLYFNKLLLKYNRCCAKLHRLRIASKNEQQQGVLKKYILRTFKRLKQLQFNIVRKAVLGTSFTAIIGFQPQKVAAQADFSFIGTNPFSLTGIGPHSRPCFGDLDGDGDLDIMSVGGNDFQYFENIGTATAPMYGVAQTNPFSLVAIAGTPSLGDLDGDGDLDLLGGVTINGFYYFENIGTSTVPIFDTLQTIPISLSATGRGQTFVDLDADGDLDVMQGPHGLSGFLYFENTGTPTSPMFGTVQINPFSLTTVWYLYYHPTFADLDTDGDLDLICGIYNGKFQYYENTGTSTAPVFAAAQLNPFGLIDVGMLSNPSLVDIDSDGDFDLMSGAYDGHFKFFENRDIMVGVENMKATSTLTKAVVYPNPVSKQISIQTKQEIEEIIIYDMLGTVVQTERRTTFSVEKLAKGSYLMNIKTESGLISSSFIKK
jgi:hypothetical protein